MKTKTAAAFSAVVFFSVFSASVAEAAFGNQNSLLVGELVAGIGGAGTAVVGDVAASSYYNPATLAPLEGSAFSAAVGVYKKFDVLYGTEEDFTKAPLRVNQGFFRSLPASTGSVIKWDDYSLAFSVVVPDYDQFKGDLRSDTENISTLNFTDESLWVGGSIAKKINESESLGLTLYYTARSMSRSVNDRSFYSPTKTTLFTSEKTVTENALIPLIGYYQKVSDRTGFGVSLRLPAMQILGRATLFSNETKIDSNDPTNPIVNTPLNEPEKSTRVVVPGQLRMGVTYEPDPTWLLSGDLSLSEGISYSDLEDETLATKVTHKAVWNVNLGVEKKFRDWLHLRTGIYSNLSSHPNPNPDLQKPQEDHVDMLGFSANFVFIAGQKIRYTFGGYYIGGKGRSSQRIDQLYRVIPKTQHVFTMLVGTSFHF